jgi:hypothetical protein
MPNVRPDGLLQEAPGDEFRLRRYASHSANVVRALNLASIWFEAVLFGPHRASEFR